MQIDRRFADYALTGGFFLICNLGMLWALGYGPKGIPKELKDLLQSADAPLVAPIVTGFTGALAVIAVFVVGLVLDLLASLLRGQEMKIFARHLDHNSEWMTAYIEAHKAYCGADYETFRRVFHEMPTPLARLKREFTDPRLWRRENWLEMKVNWGLGIAPEYERLLSFLTSYVMGQSGPAQLTLMADQYSLWRTARAIAIALWLLAIEAIIVSNILGLLASAVIIFLISWTILGFSFLIIRGPYSRLCFTLFSLLYVACDKQIVSRKDADPAP
jgi:hypothetical protein